MTDRYIIPQLPLPYDLETVQVLRQLGKANRKLAELKGIARTIPQMNEMCPNMNGYVPKNELLGTYSLRMCK